MTKQQRLIKAAAKRMTANIIRDIVDSAEKTIAQAFDAHRNMAIETYLEKYGNSLEAKIREMSRATPASEKGSELLSLLFEKPKAA